MATASQARAQHGKVAQRPRQQAPGSGVQLWRKGVPGCSDPSPESCHRCHFLACYGQVAVAGGQPGYPARGTREGGLRHEQVGGWGLLTHSEAAAADMSCSGLKGSSARWGQREALGLHRQRPPAAAAQAGRSSGTWWRCSSCRSGGRGVIHIRKGEGAVQE